MIFEEAIELSDGFDAGAALNGLLQGSPLAAVQKVQSLVDKAEPSGELPQCDRLTVPTYANIRPGVIGLHGGRSPSAVLGRIGAIRVSPVKRASRWSRPHVAYECGRIVQPTWVHGNAPGAIGWVLLVVGVVAARLCVTPCAEFWRHAVAYTVPMFHGPCDQAFFAKAPAAVCPTIAKRLAPYFRNKATCAPALPESTPTAIGGSPHYRKPPVPLANEIQSLHGLNLPHFARLS